MSRAGKMTSFQVGLAVVIAPIAGFRLLSAARWSATHEYGDFGIFYRSAQCIVAHNCDRYVMPALNLNPPFAQWVLVPLAREPIAVAYAAWMVLTFLSVIASWRLIGRAFALPGRALVVGGLALLLSTPIALLVTTGQVAGVLLLPLTILWLRDRQGRAIGAWLGPLVLWKPFLGVLALVRTGRRVWMVALSAALLFVLDFWMEGLAVYRGWVASLQRAGLSGHYLDGSIWQAAIRSCRPTERYMQIAGCESWAPAIAFVLAGTMIAWVIWRSQRATVDQGWLLGLAAGLLASPKGWIYYGCWLIGPAIAVWRDGDRLTRHLLETVAFLLLLPQAAPLLGQPSPWLTPTWGSMYLWIWLLCLVSAARRPPLSSRVPGPSLHPDPIRF